MSLANVPGEHSCTQKGTAEARCISARNRSYRALVQSARREATERAEVAARLARLRLELTDAALLANGAAVVRSEPARVTGLAVHCLGGNREVASGTQGAARASRLVLLLTGLALEAVRATGRVGKRSRLALSAQGLARDLHVLAKGASTARGLAFAHETSKAVITRERQRSDKQESFPYLTAAAPFQQGKPRSSAFRSCQ